MVKDISEVKNIKLKREFDDDNGDPWKERVSLSCRGWTHVDGKLVLKPLQIEVKIRLGHLILAPASELGENSWWHIDNEAIRTVQKGQEWPPHILLTLRGVIQEYFNSWSILLKAPIANYHWHTFTEQLCQKLTVKRSSIITSRYWMVVSFDTWLRRFKNVFAAWKDWSFKYCAFLSLSKALILW